MADRADAYARVHDRRRRKGRCRDRRCRVRHLGFSDEEWGLLVGLPQSVLTAASAAEHDGTRRTLAENAAGLEAISAGRESASPLVAAVAGELVARVGDPETRRGAAGRSSRPTRRLRPTDVLAARRRGRPAAGRQGRRGRGRRVQALAGGDRRAGGRRGAVRRAARRRRRAGERVGAPLPRRAGGRADGLRSTVPHAPPRGEGVGAGGPSNLDPPRHRWAPNSPRGRERQGGRTAWQAAPRSR